MSPIRENAAKGVAVVLGQSLNPDGSAPRVLIDRAKMAKRLLDEGKVDKVMVCGADPAGVGHTEAYALSQVLLNIGIPKADIIQEAQSTTTAENAWFALRWIPQGTGQLYIVTSDFHMARATYIFEETFNYFYMLVEHEFKHDPKWTARKKRYPRLTIHQVPVPSFCGSDASLNHDADPSADINAKSLALRAQNELRYLGSHEVSNSLFGQPWGKILYIWPIQIDVTKDPQNRANFRKAMAQAIRVANALCKCKAPPEGKGPKLNYPLELPVSTKPTGKLTQWRTAIDSCKSAA
eukprot:TRINITY_DN75511_c0_g1_i1.p1 TRINITY_DN75511_c0_g1~~TRINITY_DN75511_c0_g1_i1.p1  ORF type:complete len:294 (+),score=39.44 TRINITY_DN75511_c0_g1_i1:225-1106(+)